MRVSKSQLKHIIAESIKKQILNEYDGEQLMLPFDGDTKQYNYMQYIDFVKSITKEGTLNSNIRSINEYLNSFKQENYFEIGINTNFYHGYVRDEFDQDEYKCVIEELEEKYGKNIYGNNNNPLSINFSIGEELSDFGFKKLIAKLTCDGKNALLNKIHDLLSLNDNSTMIPINRVITIPYPLGRFTTNDCIVRGEREYNDFYDYLENEFGGLGEYWAYGFNTGDAYCGNEYKRGIGLLRIIAYVPLEYINMPDTCGAELVGESEVYFKENAKILITQIIIGNKKINLGNRIYQI